MARAGSNAKNHFEVTIYTHSHRLHLLIIRMHPFSSAGIESSLLSIVEFMTRIQNPKQPFHTQHARSTTLPRCSSQAGNNQHLRHFQQSSLSMNIPDSSDSNRSPQNPNLYNNQPRVARTASFLLEIIKLQNILPFHRRLTSARTEIAMTTTITPTMPATTRTKARTIM
jgi:hypothetical protein